MKYIIIALYAFLAFGAVSVALADDGETYAYFEYWIYADGEQPPPPCYAYCCAEPIPVPFAYQYRGTCSPVYTPAWCCEPLAGYDYNCFAGRIYFPDPPDGYGAESTHVVIYNAVEDIAHKYNVGLMWNVLAPDGEGGSGLSEASTSVKNESLGEVKASFR